MREDAEEMVEQETENFSMLLRARFATVMTIIIILDQTWSLAALRKAVGPL